MLNHVLPSPWYAWWILISLCSPIFLFASAVALYGLGLCMPSSLLVVIAASVTPIGLAAATAVAIVGAEKRRKIPPRTYTRTYSKRRRDAAKAGGR